MRKTLLLLSVLLSASPAWAQDSAAPMRLPRELTDPAAMQRLAVTMQTLSSALLNVRIGGVRAALEGREPNASERNVTVGDLARQNDPDFDRHMQQKVASLAPKLQHGVQVLNRTLPEVARDLEDARRSVERAVANMPDPNYPRR